MRRAHPAEFRTLRLRVIGDSHTTALAEGWERLRLSPDHAGRNVQVKPLGTGKMLEYRFFDYDGRGIRWIPSSYADAFRSLAGRDDLVRDDVIYGLSLGYHTAKIAASSCWIRACPWRLAPRLERAAISDAVVREMATSYAQHSLALFEALKEMGVRFFVIEAPPLKQDWKAFGKGIPPESAVEVDRLFRDAISTRLAEIDVSHLPPPSSTVNDRGFLKAEFAFAPHDPHHANAAYGEIVMIEALGLAEHLADPPPSILSGSHRSQQ